MATKRSDEPIEAMDLGNLRQLGVRSPANVSVLCVTCFFARRFVGYWVSSA